MFQDLHDAVSRLWSWRWPGVQGEVSFVEIEELQDSDGPIKRRLSVCYRFSIGNDGPYCGEDFWTPNFTLRSLERLQAAQNKLFVGQPVLVRYRADDPSVNRLDRSVWRGF
jgi:hypothetical protein